MKRLSLLAIFLSLTGLYVFIAADTLWPLPEADPNDHATTVLAQDGTPLRVFADKQGVWRFKTPLEDVSPLYIQALLGYEDRYFYWHPGINPFSVMRAAIQNLRNDEIVSGASTLSMQVARLIDPHTRLFSGKLKQVFRALQLEWHLSKTDILERYLELAPFGGNLQGVEAASHAYLGKAPIELSHAEAALLAVLPQAPSRFRPDRHPKKAALARNKLVQRLVDRDIWPAHILKDIQIEPVYANAPTTPVLAPILARRLKNRYPKKTKIQTSIDYGLQLAVQARLKDYVATLPEGTTAAAVVVENKNWQVRAYVGSALFADRKTQGYVDMVSAPRSPGSTLKPFIYGLALDQGLIHSQSLLADAPRWKSHYQPQNFTHQFSGAVSTTAALQKSLNVPAVQVLEKLGAGFFNSRLLNARVKTTLPAGNPNLSMALGGFGISMESLLNLYGALGREGSVTQLRFSKQSSVQMRPLLSPQSAWIIHSMLSDQAHPGESKVRINAPLGFKTGTSYGYRDAWAFGVSGQYTLGIWVGRPDGTPAPGQYGSETALPLLFQISDWLGDKQRPQEPEKISKATICWPGGLRKTDTPEDQCHLKLPALGIDGQFPATLPATADDDQWQRTTLKLQIARDSGLRITPDCQLTGVEKKITLWPAATEPWLQRSWQRRKLIPASDPRCPRQASVANQEITILSIKEGSTLRNLNPGRFFTLPLSTLGGFGNNTWYLNGRRLTLSSATTADVWLTPGRHELLAINLSGASDLVRFNVEQW